MRGNPLYKGIGNTMPGPIGDVKPSSRRFRDDIRNGKLPQVSWIIAPATYSEHPGPSSPAQGAWYMQEVLDALTANPEVWSKTVLLVNFDENDGFFDHVPSPAAPSLNPDGTPAGKTTLRESDVAFERFTPSDPPGTTSQPQPDGRVYGPGLRVPMYVISPWSRGGWVNSQVFDHTSVHPLPREALRRERAATSARYRRAVCGDLTSAFNFERPEQRAAAHAAGPQDHGPGRRAAAAQQAAAADHAAGQRRMLPVQATGMRPVARAALRAARRARAATRGTARCSCCSPTPASRRAVFHVYDKLHLGPAAAPLHGRARQAAGRRLGRDDRQRRPLRPVGARAERLPPPLQGRPEPPARAAARRSPRSAWATTCAAATSTSSCATTASAPAASRSRPWPTATTARGPSASRAATMSSSIGTWTPAASGTTSPSPAMPTRAYYRRFAGRVETGRHSVSDPAMGQRDL